MFFKSQAKQAQAKQDLLIAEANGITIRELASDRKKAAKSLASHPSKDREVVAVSKRIFGE